MSNAQKEILDLIQEFFKEEPKKAHIWFQTNNPLLGGLSPNEMIAMGKSKKLLQFVKAQLSENKKEDDTQRDMPTLSDKDNIK